MFKQIYLLLILLLTSCASDHETATQSQPLLTDGLLHHWTLDGDALDSAGAQDGTIVGATAVPGQVGDALDFDGSDYVDLGTFADTAATLSVTAWVNQIAWVGGSGDGRIIAISTSTSEQDHQLLLSASNGQQQCRMQGGGSTFTLKGGTATLGVWQHVACTYDGSRVRLYVDGVEVADRSWSGSVVLDMPGALGRNPSGGRNLNGVVDDVRIYSRALGATEIVELMAWQPAESGPLDAGTPDSGVDSGTDSGADSGTDSGAGGSFGMGGSAGEGGSCGTAGGGTGGATGGTGGEPVGGSGGASTGGTGEPDAGVGGSGGESGGSGGEGGSGDDAGTGGSAECEVCEPPPPPQVCTNQVTVVIAGDFGHPDDNVNSRYQELLDAVSAFANFGERFVFLASGDLGYEETLPPDWMALTTAALPNMPILASRGNHESNEYWAQYISLIQAHNAQFPWLQCSGTPGYDELCEVDGVSIVLSEVDDTNDHFRINDLYQRLLTRTPGNWTLCSWHQTLELFTMGSKFSTVPEEAYEVCRDAGAIIINAHDHNYTRSCTISDFFNPGLTADCSEPVRVGGGETFVAVSGRGGRNMAATGAGRLSRMHNGAFVTTTDSFDGVTAGPGNSDPGALLVTFGGSQPVDEARAVYLDSKLREMDRFTIRRGL